MKQRPVHALCTTPNRFNLYDSILVFYDCTGKIFL